MHGQTIAELPYWRHLALAETDSTNAEALRLAVAGEPGGLWITAERQHAGRGRRGRSWFSEAGNLHASLLLIDPAPAGALGNLPFVSALAAHRALRACTPGVPAKLSIKWPNDILVDGAKISGILLESVSLKGGRRAVVIGWGVNCAHHPLETVYPTTDLSTFGVETSPEELFTLLAQAMATTLAEWKSGAGFDSIRAAWLRCAHGIGEKVQLDLPDGRIKGIFENIDEEGHLSLRLAGGELRRISAGDLFFQ